MDVTAHNIANAGTEGYRRQEAVLEPGITINGAFDCNGPGTPKLGSGVQFQAVRRMQSDFADNQLRNANQLSGESDIRNQTMQQVESVLGEPGANGVANALDTFWNSWSELASSPDSAAAKSTVVQSADALAQRITNLHDELSVTQTQLDQQVKDNATRINDIAHQIADINSAIGKTPEGSAQPNDLLDRRDVLLDSLSKIVNFQSNGTAGSGGEMMLTISGKVLVEGVDVNEVAATPGQGQWSQLSWASDGSALNPTGGQVFAQIDLRDNVIQGYIDKLDDIAGAVVANVNSYYAQGKTSTGQGSGNFFVPNTTSANMSVVSGLLSSPGSVVTSYTGNPGDAALAQDIASVKQQQRVNGLSINDAYSALVSQIGNDSTTAQGQESTNTLSVQQLTTQRDSVSGVSLDEEMINMVRYQQAYNACARMVTVMDDMLDTVINKMGL
jgi:flagellar hook-associated protein 1